jgi:hypothetical protein
MIADIEARYPEGWVLIGDPETDQYLSVQSGVVLWHSPDREEVYRKAIELRPARCAVLHLGNELPPNTVFAL